MNHIAPRINCPSDGCGGVAPYKFGGSNVYECDKCFRQWVVSIGEAYPAAMVNPNAPFHWLVLEIDRICHAKERAAARETLRRRVA